MSRVKHLTMLIVKLVLLVLVFAVTAAMNAMQTYPTDGIPLAKNFDESNINVMLANGATLEWEVVEGELVFDITQSGDRYDDVSVVLIFDEVGYDSSFMRSLLGADAGKHEEYISQMENGPWVVHFNFCLKGDSFFTTNTGNYTFIDPITEYVEDVYSSAANKSTRTEDFTVNANEESVKVMLTFGSEESGALSNGRYILDLELKLGHPEGKKLDVSYFDVVSIVFKVAVQAVRHTGLGIFSITNWLTFYCVWVILGWFIYLWRDMRTVIGAFMSGSLSDSFIIVKDVYVNGVYSGSFTESDMGASIAVRIICAAIVWIILTVTTPIRMLWYMIRDIVYLFKEDEVLEEFSYIGNLMGSIGIHVIIMGIAGVFGVAKTFGFIALAVGIAMCVGAHFICKAVEY